MSAARAQKVEASTAIRLPLGIRNFVLIFTFVGVLTSLGVYQVFHRHRVYSMARELSTETLRYRTLLDESRKLRLELATLKRVGRIRREASDRLGMHVPAPQDIVEIR
ncbi:MAG: cell division protein FtsL [Myxococcota bacterium]|jgi:cell division protein FtsL